MKPSIFSERRRDASGRVAGNEPLGAKAGDAAGRPSLGDLAQPPRKKSPGRASRRAISRTSAPVLSPMEV